MSLQRSLRAALKIPYLLPPTSRRWSFFGDLFFCWLKNECYSNLRRKWLERFGKDEDSPRLKVYSLKWDGRTFGWVFAQPWAKPLVAGQGVRLSLRFCLYIRVGILFPVHYLLRPWFALLVPTENQAILPGMVNEGSTMLNQPEIVELIVLL